MKKNILISIICLFIGSLSFAQSNFGIKAGGGFSYAGIDFETDLTNSNVIILNIGGAFEPAYHGGFAIENIIVEKMVYFEIGLQAMSKGYKYSDNLFLLAHSIHIPLEIKYKYFFNKKGDAFVYASAGPYFSASYNGLKFDKSEIDLFADDYTGEYEMKNPRLKFGKVSVDETADMATFDYGLNIGSGFGFFGHLQIGFNWGFGIPVFEIVRADYNFDNDWDTFTYYRHRYLTMTAAYYFSNK